MVSVLTFYFDDPSSNPAEVKIVAKKNEKAKKGRDWPMLKMCLTFDILVDGTAI